MYIAPVFESVPVHAGDPAGHPGRKVKLPSGREAVVCEPAPGKSLAVVPPEDVPRYGIVRMMRQPDGRYLPTLTYHSELIQLGPNTPEHLGLRGLHWRSLRRLVQSGIVSGCFPSPHVCLMNLASLVRHLEETREQSYWTQERKEAFRTGY